MLVFLLWWTFGSFLCCVIAATIAASSVGFKSLKFVGLAVVIYWVLLGIVQWIVLNPYFYIAYQWGLVTTFGGIISSCLVVFAFLLSFWFLLTILSS